MIKQGSHCSRLCFPYACILLVCATSYCIWINCEWKRFGVAQFIAFSFAFIPALLFVLPCATAQHHAVCTRCICQNCCRPLRCATVVGCCMFVGVMIVTSRFGFVFKGHVGSLRQVRGCPPTGIVTMSGLILQGCCVAWTSCLAHTLPSYRHHYNESPGYTVSS